MSVTFPAGSHGVLLRLSIWLFIMVVLPGCSIQKMAVDRLGSAMAGSA